MAATIKFTKMQGAGNDYIYVNTLSHKLNNPEEISRRWSAYHTGIGSDGLVLIGDSDKADFSMRIFNADGSEAMMCGNASRCIGKYIYDNKLTDKTEITLDTLSGIKVVRLHIKNDKVEKVTVDMGTPEIEYSQPITVGNATYKGSVILMGNPHLVIFTDDVETLDLTQIGPLLENHPFFPNRTNVEFAQVIDNENIRMRVWERGSGITQACGTGACATAIAASLTGRTGREVAVKMDGGVLEIHWDADTGRVFMTGDAVKVFDGEIELEE